MKKYLSGKRMYRLIDTHAHLDEIEDIESVLAAAREAGLAAIVAVGSDLASNVKVLELSGRYGRFVYPALGWHPWFIRKADIAASLEFIESHADEAVAIGEVGLDYHKRVRARADKALQKQVLGEILKIARAHDKPALIHSRYAWRDALDAVLEAGLDKAVFHWYTGTSSVRRDIISSGYYISVTPAVEYHEEHRRTVKEVPLERMLLETDCPVVYQRGSPNEFTSRPADVIRSLKGAAALKGVSEEEIAEVTAQNAMKLFGIT
jgi:TatD DNase family protein